MEVGSSPKVRRRARRRSRFRDARRGVVAVVGTLLSLLVFFALFGIFITQFVPVWMADNESAFTAQFQASFAQMKSDIDLQELESGPPSFATPFTLSSLGIPLIAQPTAATLGYIPHYQGTYVDVTEQIGPGGASDFSENLSLGAIQAALPNRYFPSQTFEYEDDAVIQSEGGNDQVMMDPPVFSVNSTGDQNFGSFGLLQLYGNATQLVSTGTVEVYSHFGTVLDFPSNGSAPRIGRAAGTPFDVTIRVGTLYPCAWANYLNSTMAGSGLSSANWTLTPTACSAYTGQSTMIVLSLPDMTNFNLFVASFTVQIGVGQS
ncbi:MAG: type II secretion system protein [Thermoplasmata archaeon]